MNRIWMRYFGRGIVETEEDFGTQGTPPTHPELLDWLAAALRDGSAGATIADLGMRNAELKKTTASVTPQSQSKSAIPTVELKSDASPDRQQCYLSPVIRNSIRNPQLRNRIRNQKILATSSFLVRNGSVSKPKSSAMLHFSASGLLNPKIGGSSVRPPQPDGVYSFTQNKKNWVAAAGAERFRRAMYTHFYRSAPYPLLTTFDSPDFQQVCTRRQRSDTPLQSLTLANDPAFLEIAQGLAARLVREVPGEFSAMLDARLKHAFALCFSRPPSATELAALRSYIERQATNLLRQRHW